MMRRNRTKGPAPVAEPQAVQGESPSDTTAAEAEYRRCVIASATSTNGQVLPTRDVFLALSRSPADFAEAVATYITDRGSFRENFPARSAILDKLFNKPEKNSLQTNVASDDEIKTLLRTKSKAFMAVLAKHGVKPWELKFDA